MWFPIITLTNCSKLSFKKPQFCVKTTQIYFFTSWRLELWNRSHCVKAKVSSGFVPAGSSKGKSVSLYLPASKDYLCHLGSWPLSPPSKPTTTDWVSCCITLTLLFCNYISLYFPYKDTGFQIRGHLDNSG